MFDLVYDIVGRWAVESGAVVPQRWYAEYPRRVRGICTRRQPSAPRAISPSLPVTGARNGRPNVAV